MEFPLNGYRYPYCFPSLQQPYTSLCVYVSEYPTEMTISTLVTGSRPCVYQIWIPIMTPFVCKLGLADGRFGNIWHACVKTINPLDDITHHRIQSVPDEWQQVGRKNSWDSSFSHSTDFAASPRLCGEDRNGKATTGQKKTMEKSSLSSLLPWRKKSIFITMGESLVRQSWQNKYDDLFMCWFFMWCLPVANGGSFSRIWEAGRTSCLSLMTFKCWCNSDYGWNGDEVYYMN